MAKKDALKNLVKSLTKGEKRYFRMQSDLQSGDKNYLKLFDYIDSHTDSSAKSLNEHFSLLPMGKQLHVTKHYLSSMIMKSLRIFYDQSSKQQELSALISEAEILFRKELLYQCEGTLNKAQKTAEKYERFNELLIILGWRRRLMSSQGSAFQAAKPNLSYLTYEADIIRRLQNLNDYQLLTNQLLSTNFSDQTAISSLSKNSLLSSEKMAQSFNAKVLYYHIQYILDTLSSRANKAEHNLKLLLSLFENQAHQIVENMEGYVTSLNNLLSFYIHRRQQAEALEVLSKIRQLPDKHAFKDRNYLLKVFLKTYNAELELYRDTKDWRKGLDLIKEVQQFIHDNSKIITDGQLISFHYQFAYIFFMSNDYSKSLKALNSMINMNLRQDRQDVQMFSRFLLLMVHFELGNIIVLRYAVDTTRRFLKKNKGKLVPFEKCLLKFFSKLSTSPSSNYTQIFEKLKSDLFIGIDDRQKDRILDYLDFNAWIEKHL